MTNAKVSPLKKVSLAIAAASCQDLVKSADEHLFLFIYGAASGGLCPFEIELAGKHSGEVLTFNLNQDDVCDFFGHLFMSLRNSLSLHILPQQLYFRVAINVVERAEDIEIITAMKEYLGSGCGGGCDCGCH